NEDRARALARDALGCGAQKTRREFFVDSAVTNDDQIGDFGPFANLVGNEPDVQKDLVFDFFLPAALHEVVQNRFAPLLQHFTHLGGEIEIWFKPEGPGDVVEKSAFDGNRVDDVLAENGAVEFLSDPDGVV